MLNKAVYVIKKYKTSIYIVILAFLLLLIILEPILHSGYQSDDMQNSKTNGYLLEWNQSIQDFTKDRIQGFMNIGRFYPLANIIYPIFAIITNLFMYKLYIIFLICLNVLLFGFYVRLLTNSSALCLISVTIIPIFMQTRLGHDPIASYNGFMQFFFLLFLLTLIFLELYFKKSRLIIIILSYFSFTLCILMYEVSSCFFILPLLALFLHANSGEKRKILFLSIPYVLISAIYIAINIILRQLEHISAIDNKSNYAANLDYSSIFITIFHHVMSAIPLSYAFFNPNNIFYKLEILYSNSFSIPILIFVISLFLWIKLSKSINEELVNIKNLNVKYSYMYYFGALFLILPGVVISFSVRYQKEILLGYSHLPIYLSYFGLCMIFAGIIYYIYSLLIIKNKFLYNCFTVLLVLLLGVSGILVYNNNSIIVDDSNQVWLYPRLIIENGIQDGLFNSISNGSILFVDNNYPWNDPVFYRMHSNIHFSYVGHGKGAPYENKLGYRISNNSDYLNLINDKDNQIFISSMNKVNSYYLKYYSTDASNGYAILCKIINMTSSDDKIEKLSANSCIVYARSKNIDLNSIKGADLNMPLNNQLLITGYYSANDSVGNIFILNENKMKLESKGNDYKLFDFNTSPMEFDPRYICLNYGTNSLITDR